MSDKLIKKLEELVELIKAVPAPTTIAPPSIGGKDNGIKQKNLNPTLKLPGATGQNKSLQLAGTASAKSKKDPVHQAKHIKDAATKDYAMTQAKAQNKAMSNPLAFGKSEADEKRFHLVKEHKQAGPSKTESEILSEFGSFGEAEKQGYKIVPVVKEYLKQDGNGQWTLLEKNESVEKDDKIDQMIRAKMKQEMDRRGITDKDVADHYRDIDESIPAKQRTNIKAALKQQKIKEQPKPKLTVIKAEDEEDSEDSYSNMCNAAKHLNLEYSKEDHDNYKKQKKLAQALGMNYNPEHHLYQLNAERISKADSLEKDNSVKPFKQNIYNETANIGRKMSRYEKK